MDAGERDQGDEVSGMSDSGTPKRRPAAAAASHGDEAAGPSGRAGGGGSGGGDTGGGEDGGAGDGGAAGGLDPTNEERVRRRREINRNSQKRIRERRNKEMDELRLEVRARARRGGAGGVGANSPVGCRAVGSWRPRRAVQFPFRGLVGAVIGVL